MPVKYRGIILNLIFGICQILVVKDEIYTERYIYTELAPKLSATASVAQLVERWSRDPEGAGSIPSWRPWSCIFSNWSRLSLKINIFTTLEFTTPYFNYHLLTTSANAKY